MRPTALTAQRPPTPTAAAAGRAARRTLAALLAAVLLVAGCAPPEQRSKPLPHTRPAATQSGRIDYSQFKPRPVGTGGPVALTAGPTDASGQSIAPAEAAYVYREPSKDGIGKFYMGREIAKVMGHLAAGWLERPDREREEKPQQVIEWMELRKTDVVADIGAGTGYFSFRIAEKVPDGKVLATDIQPEMLDLLRRQAAARGVRNIEPLLGKTDDPALPADAVDVVLMVDAYHEFDHPREMLAGIAKGLKPGGRVVLVEYRGEDPTVPIKPLHKMTQAQAKREFAVAGLEYVKTFDGLPSQHVMIFRKPAPAAAPAPAPGDPGDPAAPAPAPATQGASQQPVAADDDPKRLVLSVAPRFAVVKLEASVAYYRDKLGFTVDREEHGFAVVSRDGVSIQLIVPEQRPAGPRDATQFAADCDAYVVVRDANALHDEFRRNGALIAQPPQKRRDMIEFDVATPDGGVIRFAQRGAGATR